MGCAAAAAVLVIKRDTILHNLVEASTVLHIPKFWATR